MVGRPELARMEEEGGNTYNLKIEYLSRADETHDDISSGPCRTRRTMTSMSLAQVVHQRVEAAQQPPHFLLVGSRHRCDPFSQDSRTNATAFV